jgi:hypothetical protein
MVESPLIEDGAAEIQHLLVVPLSENDSARGAVAGTGAAENAALGGDPEIGNPGLVGL